MRLGSRRRSRPAQPVLAGRARARPRGRRRIAARGVREGHLAELFEAAGLRQVEETALTASLEHSTFEDWWEPFTRGVGPAGSSVASLDALHDDFAMPFDDIAPIVGRSSGAARQLANRARRRVHGASPAADVADLADTVSNRVPASAR